MYYIYILFSKEANRYYIGYSSDPFRRLEEHNTSRLDSYTARNRPWEFKAIFECGEDKGNSLRIERFINPTCKFSSKKIII